MRMPFDSPMTRIAFAAIGLGFLGCTSSSPATPDAGSDSGPEVTCQNDPRVQPYTASLSQTSSGGGLKVTIMSADPAPPVTGTNTWIVKAESAQGAPLAGAPKVEPFMPDHNHGPSVKATATAQPDGTFKVTPIEFIMPGVWRITFTSPAPDGGAPESVAFFLCVSD
jgi:hypothetical protein